MSQIKSNQKKKFLKKTIELISSSVWVEQKETQLKNWRTRNQKNTTNEKKIRKKRSFWFFFVSTLINAQSDDKIFRIRSFSMTILIKMKIFSNFFFERSKNSFEMFFWIFLIKFSLSQNAKKRLSADLNADKLNSTIKMSILISLLKCEAQKLDVIIWQNDFLYDV